MSQEINPALDCWFVTGHTAAGKSQVGAALAERIGAEIISLDSMAVYRYMDIGTAKPSAELRRRAPHHLIDVVDPSEQFSLSQYVEAAHAKISEIRQRGRQALFVGGTPLYLKALLRGLYEGPPPDWDFRRQVRAEAEEVGIEALHERLKVIDPLLAAKLHPRDSRRIIRALEVYRVTGEPLSHQQLHFEEGYEAHECRVFVLDWPREKLHERIDARVERMFERGLVDETRQVLSRFGQLSRTASQAVGYRETLEHLEGQRDLEATISLVKTRTRQLAKRQETWFRGLSECRRLPQQEGESPEEIAARIVADAEEHGRQAEST